MAYNPSDSIVRGDLFKKSGKWAHTVVITMGGLYECSSIHEAVVRAVRSTPEEILGVAKSAVCAGCGYTLVVLEPYHQHSHPVMIDLDKE